MTDQPIIDEEGFAQLAEIADGDAEFLNELIDTYAEDGAIQVGRLRDAASRADITSLVIGAHSLKSSSLNVGAVVVAERCRSLEEEGRAGSVTDGPARVEAIGSAFEAARAALLERRAVV